MVVRTGRFCYAASETCADLLYLSGFSAPDPFLWIQVGGEQFTIVNTMEYGRACLQGREGVKVLTFEQAAALWKISGRPSAARIIAGAARLTDTWLWETPWHCPLQLANEILDTKFRTVSGTTGSRIKIRTESGVFCPGRLVKSDSEREALRRAERIAEAGLARAIDIISDSSIGQDGILLWQGQVLTSETLRGEINGEIARKGGSAAGTIAAPGVQGANPHDAGHGPVRANQPIVIDIFPRDCETGYFGDLTRTVLKGHAPDIVKAAFNAVYDAQKTVLAMLKPGITGVEAHRKASDVMASHGFKTDLSPGAACGFIHGLGHGVGLEIHEQPSLNLRNGNPLEIGNVVTVEPGLYYPDWGGIRIEDMVAITADGIDDLTSCPVFLEID